jgi:glycosyltransferase involved in cell wall biosynthesis
MRDDCSAAWLAAPRFVIPFDMNAPKISVIIPTLNSVRFIGEAIDSALNQSVPVSEILVVDGGSRDGTVEAARKIGGPVQVLSQEGRGRPGARNTGLRRATGDFIALLDSDDLWVPGKLAAQLDFFKKYSEIEMVFGDMALFARADDANVPEILDVCSR